MDLGETQFSLTHPSTFLISKTTSTTKSSHALWKVTKPCSFGGHCNGQNSNIHKDQEHERMKSRVKVGTMEKCQVHALTKLQRIVASWKFCICVTALPIFFKKHANRFMCLSKMLRRATGSFFILTLSRLNITRPRDGFGPQATTSCGLHPSWILEFCT